MLDHLQLYVQRQRLGVLRFNESPKLGSPSGNQAQSVTFGGVRDGDNDALSP